MKSAWPIKQVADVCEVFNGGTPKTRVPAYWNGPHKWITPAEMGKRASPYVADTERTLTNAGLENSSASLLPAKSVILSSRAPIGHLVINTLPMATNQGCKGLVPRSSLNYKFLYYYLFSIREQLDAMGTGATFRELSGGRLKEVPIPVPPLPEQQRIVRILDEAFESIAKAKAITEKNLANSRALFESHLNEVFTKRGQGWIDKPLAHLSTILNGYAFKSSDFTNKPGTKCIKITNVGVNQFVGTADEYLPPRFATNYKGVSVQSGSIVLALTRTIINGGLKIAVVPDCYDGALLNQRVASIVANQNLLKPSFLYAYFATELAMEYVRERVNTLMQPNLSIADLRSMPIPVPSIPEQHRIADKIQELRNETHRLESIYKEKLNAFMELKESLLYQAFTGYL